MSDVVWLLVVKGNLRHRIDLLGVEHEYEILNETQRCLRDSVRDIYSLEICPERPVWAGGAFVFLLPEHEECAKELIDQEILFLRSKHVLVSAGLSSRGARDAKASVYSIGQYYCPSEEFIGRTVPGSLSGRGPL